MRPEFNSLSLDQLIDVFHRPSPEGEDYAFEYYSEVALKIRQQGEIGVNALWNDIEKANIDRLRAIIVALSMPAITQPKLIPLANDRLLKLSGLLKKYLQHDEPFVIMEAIDGLRHLEDRSVVNQVLTLRDHHSPYVRGSVLRYMAKLWPEQSYQLLLNALSDQNFIVRESALDELGELGRPEAIPHIQLLLKDEHPDVQQAATTALGFLTNS